MNSIDICPVILAGGAGTRLWPLSRQAFPKQLLSLNGSGSLLQMTVTRLDSVETRGGEVGLTIADPIMVCHEEHRFLVVDQLESIGRRAASIPLEPYSRNTAPALTIAAWEARQLAGDPVMVVMPADHVIKDPQRFARATALAAKLALDGDIVTFGIVPARAETGYGYIRKGEPVADVDEPGAFVVGDFVEKPNLETAERYLGSGDYLWNSGLFVVKVGAWLEAIERYRPDISEACRSAWDAGKRDGSFYRVDKDLFRACPSDSIDYAVMERLTAEVRGVESRPSTAKALVVPLDAGWSDIGSWPAVLDLNERDGNGNFVYGDGQAFDTKNSLLFAEDRFVAALGLENVVVVETPDAVLVADKAHCQDVKRVVDWLKEAGREEGTSHRQVFRPWGSYEPLDAGDRFQVKRLTVKPGASLSLQMHHHRAEHWVVVRGTARVTRGDDVFLLTENQSTYIPLGVTHRLENPGKVVLEVIEVQSGSYLGEDDIVRFEDRYNRAPQP